jgi:hypothetical protein
MHACIHAVDHVVFHNANRIHSLFIHFNAAQPTLCCAGCCTVLQPPTSCQPIPKTRPSSWAEVWGALSLPASPGAVRYCAWAARQPAVSANVSAYILLHMHTIHLCVLCLFFACNWWLCLSPPSNLSLSIPLHLLLRARLLGSGAVQLHMGQGRPPQAPTPQLGARGCSVCGVRQHHTRPGGACVFFTVADTNTPPHFARCMCLGCMCLGRHDSFANKFVLSSKLPYT